MGTLQILLCGVLHGFVGVGFELLVFRAWGFGTYEFMVSRSKVWHLRP